MFRRTDKSEPTPAAAPAPGTTAKGTGAKGRPTPTRREAEAAARRPLTAHRDRTGEHFVTLDPASSTDLDQAFAIAADGVESTASAS